MEQVASGITSGSSALGITKNFSILKEPRGMIKVVQLLMCILAFATTTSYDSGFTVTFVNCVLTKDKKSSERTYLFNWSYPFRVSDDNQKVPNPCDAVKEEPKPLIWGDYSASSQFFVAVGVLSMLYAVATLIIYIFFDGPYRSNPRIAQYDFFVGCALTCFWLLSAAAWAADVSDLKFYTDPMRVLRDIDFCRDNVTRRVNTANCVVDDDDYPDYATLHVSLIAGFTCFAVFAGGLWFLFKETSYAERVLPSMQNPWDSVPSNAAGNAAGLVMPGGPQPTASGVSNPFQYGGNVSAGNGQFDGRYATPGAAQFANPGMMGGAPTGYVAQPVMGGYVPPGPTAYGQAVPGPGMPRM